jgi:hypothetical protein
MTWSEKFSAFLSLLFSPMEKIPMDGNVSKRIIAACVDYISDNIHDTLLSVGLGNTTKQS